MASNRMYLTSEPVRQLELAMLQAMAFVKRIGVRFGKVLRGLDLIRPDRR